MPRDYTIPVTINEDSEPFPLSLEVSVAVRFDNGYVDTLKFQLVETVMFCGHSRTPSMAESEMICKRLNAKYRECDWFQETVNEDVVKEDEKAASWA